MGIQSLSERAAIFHGGLCGTKHAFRSVQTVGSAGNFAKSLHIAARSPACNASVFPGAIGSSGGTVGVHPTAGDLTAQAPLTLCHLNRG